MQDRTRHRPRTRLMMALVGAVIVALALLRWFGVASAQPGGFDPYIYRDTGERADPVNLIFHGADPVHIARAFEDVLGWRPIDGSAMRFHDGTDRATAWQLGLDLGRGARFHVRIEAMTPTDVHPYVLSAAHRDEPVACGHVGAAFDDVRDMIATAFEHAGYAVIRVTLGATTPARHCNGSLTAGDGTAVIIDLETRRTTGP